MMQCQSKACNFVFYVKHYWLFHVVLLLTLAIWALHLNQPLFYAINKLHILLPNQIWGTINYLTYTKYGILPVTLILYTLFFQRSKVKLVIFIYLINLIVVYMLKAVVLEARPIIALPTDTFFWLYGSEDVVHTAYKSFPSGHTSNVAIFGFTIMGLFVRNSNLNKSIQMQINTVLFLLLLLTGFARICTGWHWPLDVLASGLIGFIIVKVSLKLFVSKR